MVTSRSYFVYIIANDANSVLYTGMTNSLLRRIYCHKEKLIPGFTSRYFVNKLVYYEIFDSPLTAIQREKQIKKWNRQWKIDLIQKRNPDLKDLYDEIIAAWEGKEPEDPRLRGDDNKRKVGGLVSPLRQGRGGVGGGANSITTNLS